MNQRSQNCVGGGFSGVVADHSLFEQIISLENLLAAWREFKRGKGSKPDVQEFELNLETNLFKLHDELKAGRWQPSPYFPFYVHDPKLRHIHKASVPDRVVHQALFRVLYPIFDKGFIFDSYSCRLGKGTHRAVKRLDTFLRQVSRNYTLPAFALKCDIKKFFEAVDHGVLIKLLSRIIKDSMVLWLCQQVVKSFAVQPGKGLPLGNVTSQLFANIYLNKLDQFVKRHLKARYYLRYCDDFIIVHPNDNYLKELISKISSFLKRDLRLSLHGQKVIIRKYGQGVDFLGYVILPHYRVLRTKTKKRMFRKIKNKDCEVSMGLINQSSFEQSLNSYLGVLRHCHGKKLSQNLRNYSYE